MTVGQVGPGTSTTGPLRTATQAAPAAGNDSAAPAASAPAASDNYTGTGGTGTQLDPQEALQIDLPDVQQPPPPPILDTGNEQLPKFGNINQPPPKSSSGPGKTNQGQEVATVQLPPQQPLQKTKWSIITGPPQGDG